MGFWRMIGGWIWGRVLRRSRGLEIRPRIRKIDDTLLMLSLRREQQRHDDGEDRHGG